jgi:hypothetical protein
VGISSQYLEVIGNRYLSGGKVLIICLEAFGGDACLRLATGEEECRDPYLK